MFIVMIVHHFKSRHLAGKQEKERLEMQIKAQLDRLAKQKGIDNFPKFCEENSLSLSLSLYSLTDGKFRSIETVTVHVLQL